jgi:hypothetical protein
MFFQYLFLIGAIISFVKPDLYLTKKMKSGASEEQKAILIGNMRMVYSGAWGMVFIILGFIDSLPSIFDTSTPTFTLVALILGGIAIMAIVFFTVILPAIKANSAIVKGIG